MITQLKERLETLKQELQQGQQRITEVHQQEQELEATLLRISGAIQVLQEEIEKSENPQIEVKKAS